MRLWYNMAEIVDPKTGKVRNVSQRKADSLSETYSEEIKKTVSQEAKSISDKGLNKTAADAAESFKNAGATIGGQISGQVNAGLLNLESKVDGYKQELTDAKDTVTGILEGDAAAIDNLKTDIVNSAMSAISSKLGTKVTIEFSEPDPDTGIVTPITVSLDAENNGADTIAGVLAIITGLGISADGFANNFEGELQNALGVNSPEGLVSVTDKIKDKVGAFTSTTINQLSTDAITSVTNELKQTVKNSLAAGNANINKSITYISSVSDGGTGNPPTTTTTTVQTNVGGGLDTYTDSAEFNLAIGKQDSDGLLDIAKLVTKDIETKINPTKLKTSLSELSNNTQDGDTILSSVNNAEQTRSDYSINVERYKGIVSNRVAGGSSLGVVQGLSLKTLTTIRQTVKNVAPKLSDAEVENLIALSQGDAVDMSNAIKLLQDNTDLTYKEAQRFLKSIDTTITNSTRLPPDTVILSEPYVIGSYSKNWNKGLNDPVFPYISSTAELQAEIAIIEKSRTVDKVIVHWTETHTNKNIGSEEINEWHLKAGLDGIGYHYVCRRDGSLQRGRPISLDGQHTPDNDNGTIGFVFVGGINAPTGTPNEENFLSSQSLTRSQINTFDHFCRTLYNVYPGIKIFGHNEVDETGLNVDPGFDVSDYVLTRFGKTND